MAGRSLCSIAPLHDRFAAAGVGAINRDMNERIGHTVTFWPRQDDRTQHIHDHGSSVRGLTVFGDLNLASPASIPEGSLLAGLVHGLGQLYEAVLWVTNDLSLHVWAVELDMLEIQPSRAGHSSVTLVELEDDIQDSDCFVVQGETEVLSHQVVDVDLFDSSATALSVSDEVSQPEGFDANSELLDVSVVLPLEPESNSSVINMLPSDEHVKSLLDSTDASSQDMASSSSAAAGPATRRRGRPKKSETPLTVAVVRHSPRNHNNGYIHPGPPDTRHHPTSIPAATPPAVLQVAELQRLGIEECLIAPEELSEARLRQERDA
ncbi:hypothetical protein ACQ4PT_060654 [Festuca glaucescens]